MIKALMKYLQIIYRTVKSVALRPFMLAKYKFKNIFNISKYLSKIPKVFAAILAKLKLKPEKREDYVDAGPIFIAKSLLVILVVLLIAIPFVIVNFVWPWIVSLAFTAHLCTGEPRLEGYNGKVEIYYEEKLENMKFKGRLEEGKALGYGEEFYEDGSLKYAGPFVEGKYEGIGEYHIAPGVIYKGDFRQGKREGQGQVFEDEVLTYEGSFVADMYEGEGIEYYPSGQVQYKGFFKAGLYSGQGVFNDEQGNKRYEGDFAEGLFNGEGRYYDSQGTLVYTGSFLNGLYDGEGKLIHIPNSMWYEGPFLAGKASGEGKLYKFGQLYYEGTFIEDEFSGSGVLTDSQSGLIYAGTFAENDIAYGKLFELSVPDLYTSFSKGMSEDITDEDYFYLYNKGFGLVLKLSYANETAEAKLVQVFRRPEGKSIANNVPTAPARQEEKDQQGQENSGEVGAQNGAQTGARTLEEHTARLLSIQGRTMNTHDSSFEGYGLRYWIDPKTEEVVLVEYYPQEQQEEAASGEGSPGVGAISGEEDGQKYTAYFEDLGLDIADFGSLGW